MASITTVDGIRFLVDSGAICAIADRDAGTGAPGTVVYGLAPAALRVSESVDALLHQLGVTSSFARFTRADGSPILINGKSVAVARQPLPGEYAAGVNSVIFAGTLTAGVRESLDEVKQGINRAGGSL
ncbi:MAG TPA: hypothetical protein VFX20_07730 [Steroidobacteraceae bacterium]|nr:hypothetical protein [Steroidobacteraceae bacterium]